MSQNVENFGSNTRIIRILEEVQKECFHFQSESDEVTVCVESESLVTQTVSTETESSTIATAPST